MSFGMTAGEEDEETLLSLQQDAFLTTGVLLEFGSHWHGRGREARPLAFASYSWPTGGILTRSAHALAIVFGGDKPQKGINLLSRACASV